MEAVQVLAAPEHFTLLPFFTGVGSEQVKVLHVAAALQHSVVVHGEVVQALLAMAVS